MYIPRNQLDEVAELGRVAGSSGTLFKNAYAANKNRIEKLTLEYAIKPKRGFVRKEKTILEAFSNGFLEGQQEKQAHIENISQLLQHLSLEESFRDKLSSLIFEGQKEVFGLYLLSERNPYELFFREGNSMILEEEKIKQLDFEAALEKSSLQRVLDILLKYSYQQRQGETYLIALGCKIDFYQLRSRRYHKEVDSKSYQSEKQQIVQKVQPFWSRILPM